MGCIVFVGKRNGAIQAARKKGIPFGIISQKKTDVGDALFNIQTDLSAFDIDIGIINSYDIKGVLALTEKSVVFAAKLRKRLGLHGINAKTAERCTDKVVMKRAFNQFGIPCTRFLTAEDNPSADEIVQYLRLPIVIKAKQGSGSRGTELIRFRKDMRTLKEGEMAEAFIDGTEMSVESIIVDGQVRFTNITRYFIQKWANILPAEQEEVITEQILDLNRKIITSFGINEGMTHLEIFLTDEGIMAGEIAARPPGGHIMKLIKSVYTFDPWEALIDITLRKPPSILSNPIQTAGVWLLHPGRGTITRLEGVEDAKKMVDVDVHMKVSVGDDVEERVGTGQEVGHIIVTGSSVEDVEDKLMQAHNRIEIRVKKS